MDLNTVSLCLGFLCLSFVVSIIGAIFKGMAESKEKKITEESMTPLMHAVVNKDVNQVRQLLDGGADVNATTPLGDTALIFATRDGVTEIARLLIEKGATVDVRGNLQETPLILAVRSRNAELVQLLLDKGASVNVTHLYREEDSPQLKQSTATPLYYAVKNGDVEIAKLLMEKGATGQILGSLLHYPIKNKDKEMLRFLIERGVDVNKTAVFDVNFKTPLQFAQQEGNQEIIEILKQAGAKE